MLCISMLSKHFSIKRSFRSLKPQNQTSLPSLSTYLNETVLLRPGRSSEIVEIDEIKGKIYGNLFFGQYNN